MFCTNCGNQIDEGQRFCTSCGDPVKGTEKSFNSEIKQKAKKVKKPWTFGRFVKYAIVTIIVVGLLFIKLILSAVGLVDQAAVTSNDKGLDAMERGDMYTATQQLEEAADSAVTSSAKLTTLANLGYVYSSDGNYTKALQSFKEALTHASVNSSDYYLISGEIALIEKNPLKALQNYKSAYNLKPNDFQVNNALNLFYLDMEDAYPSSSDYKKALEHGLKAYSSSPSETKGTVAENLGLAYFLNEDYGNAITYLNKSSNPSQPTIQFWIGAAYYAQEQFVTAKPYLQRAKNGGVSEADEFLLTY
jgi:tetratricopeptide (TPR) repeat protein